MYLHRAFKQICCWFDGVAASCSSVLEVGEELGVEDGVAVLHVVDGVESVDGGDRDDGHHDGDPDAGLLASDHAGVGSYSRGTSCGFSRIHISVR